MRPRPRITRAAATRTSTSGYPISRPCNYNSKCFFFAFYYNLLTIFSFLVPIYDGRMSNNTPFNFTDQDFKALSIRPLWKQGKEEVGNNLVAIGYTASTFGDSKQFLSLNLQFVIVLD